MDWQKMITDIVIWIIGAIASGVGVYLINFIKTKVKEENNNDNYKRTAT